MKKIGCWIALALCFCISVISAWLAVAMAIEMFFMLLPPSIALFIPFFVSLLFLRIGVYFADRLDKMNDKNTPS